MCERAVFIRSYQQSEETMAALCRRFGVSRKTGYKWLERYAEEGDVGLCEHSRAPHQHPNMTSQELEKAIVAIRQATKWGPKKIAVRLAKNFAREDIPSLSTIGDIVKRNGLLVPRKFRRHCSPSTQPLAHAVESNRVWCADFKGWFCTADGHRVDPLTVSDAHSRYLLACQGMRGKTDTTHVMGVFETLFRSYGMPERIRTDNGSPFASTGLAGLSRLSVWWMRLGITPERIKPATPSENGRHERMHLTLKQDTATPPSGTPKKQQEAFDRFVRYYNEERPHEALGQVVPAAVYVPSPRPYPHRLPAVEYGDDMQVRRVRGAGQMKWGGRDVLVTQALSYQAVGLKQIDDGVWEVYFCTTPIGIFDERKPRVRPLKPGEQEYSVPQ
jgi:putative transposase